MAASQSFKSAFPAVYRSFKITMYSGFFAILANLVATVVLTPITRRLDPREPADETAREDYLDLTESVGGAGRVPA